MRLHQVQFQVPRLIALGEPAHHPDGQVGQIVFLRLLLGAFPVAPHAERLGSRPLHRTFGNRAQPARGTRHVIRVHVDALQDLGIAAVDCRHLVIAEVERLPLVAGVPLSDVAQPVARIAQPLRVEHHVGVHVAVYRGIRVDLVVDPVVPVVRAGEDHRARRAADRRGRVAPLAQHPLARQPVQVRRAARRSGRRWSPTAAGPS